MRRVSILILIGGILLVVGGGVDLIFAISVGSRVLGAFLLGAGIFCVLIWTLSKRRRN